MATLPGPVLTDTGTAPTPPTQPQGLVGDPLPTPAPQPAAAASAPVAPPLVGDPLPEEPAQPPAQPQGPQTLVGAPLPAPASENGDAVNSSNEHPFSWLIKNSLESMKDAVVSPVESFFNKPLEKSEVFARKLESGVANLEGSALEGVAGIRAATAAQELPLAQANDKAQAQKVADEQGTSLAARFDQMLQLPAMEAKSQPQDTAAIKQNATTAPENTDLYAAGSAIIDHWQETEAEKAQSVRDLGAPVDTALTAVGNFAPYLVTGATAGLPALGALGVTSSAGNQLQDAVENKATQDQKNAATWLGSLFGASYLIPAHIMLSPIAKLPGGAGLIKQLASVPLKKVGATALASGLQQAAVQVASNMTARDFAGYDPKRDPMAGVAAAFAGGFGVGAFMTYAVHLAGGTRPSEIPEAPPVQDSAESPTSTVAPAEEPQKQLTITKPVITEGGTTNDIVPPVSHFAQRTSEFLAKLPQSGPVTLDAIHAAVKDIGGPEAEAVQPALEKFAGRDTVDAQELQHAVQDQLLPFITHSFYGSQPGWADGAIPRNADPVRAANNITHVIRGPYQSRAGLGPIGPQPLSRVFTDYYGHAAGFYGNGVTPHIKTIHAPFSKDPVSDVQLIARQAIITHAAKGEDKIRFWAMDNDPLGPWLQAQGAYKLGRLQGESPIAPQGWWELPLKPEWGNIAQIKSDHTGLGYIAREQLAQTDKRMGNPPPPPVTPPSGGEGSEPPERFPPAEQPLRADLDRFWIGSKYMDSIRMLAIKNKDRPVIGGLLHNYLDVDQRARNTSLAWRYRGSETLNQFRKFKAKDKAAIAKFIYDLSEISRTQGRQEIGSQAYIDLAKKYNLNEAQMNFHRKLDGDFQASLKAIREVWLKELKRIYLPDNQASYNKAASEVEKTIKKIGDQNFVPYSRFGKRAVSVIATDSFTDADGHSWKPGQTVEMQTLEGSFSHTRGKMLASQLSKKYKDKPVQVVPHWLTDRSSTWEGIPAEMKDTLSNELKLDENQRATLSDLIAALSPSQSFAKHMMERKGTPGFSKDLGRSIAEYFTKFSSHIARLEHSGEFRDILRKVSDSAMDLKYQGIDNQKRMQIYEALNDHYDYLMNPQNEMAGFKALAYLYYLEYLPRSAAIVLSQQPMFIYPHLAAMAGGPGIGDFRAIRAIAGAYKTQIKRVYERSTRDSNNRFVHPGVIEPGLSDVLQRLEKEGVTNQAFNSMLATSSKGSLIARYMSANPIVKTIQSIGAFGSYPLSMMEQLNRQLTAIAGYRIIKPQMEKKLGYKEKDFTKEDKEDLYHQVKEGVLNTNFDYHRSNRPRYMWGKKSALFVFTHFFREAMFFQRRMPGRGRSLLMLTLMAGLTAFPLIENLADLYDAFMNSPVGRSLFNTPPGKYIDVDADAHEAVNQMLSKTMLPKVTGMSSQQLTEMVMHGALHRWALGPAMMLNMFGHIMPDMDMTSAVSEGRLLPGTEYAAGLASHQYPEFADKVAGGIVAASGVMGGLTQRLVQALVQPNQNTYREIEALTPRAVNTTMKMAKAASDGKFTDSSGRNIGYVDMKNPAQASELIAGGLTGFQPTRVTEAQEVEWKQMQAAKFFEGQRRYLLANYSQAVVDRDPVARADAMAEIRKFNASSPKGVLIIDKEIINAVEAKAKLAALKASGEQSRKQVNMDKAVMPSFQGKEGQPFLPPDQSQP